ncbi:MAG: purine-nucleoside phosphorylase [Proteobacteria bacterium]|nr:purine-nucleoside phosphorylase [Pseudomonadota bacterium]
METSNISQLKASADYIESRFSLSPEVAIVLGSGFGPLADQVENPTVIPYDAVPHFARSTIDGHAGELVCGKLKGKNVVCMNGRFHYYEGYSLDVVTYPIKVFKLLGINTLILTNAAGGINTDYTPGDLMIVTDHINFMGSNPLIGPNIDSLGTRFPDMTEAYSKRLIELAGTSGRDLGIDLKNGFYVAVSGPSFETPAEIRMLRTLGADAVGMSTVPEAIVANHMGMEVLAISCITNAAAGISGEKLSHEEVNQTASRVKDRFVSLLSNIVENMDPKSK